MFAAGSGTRTDADEVQARLDLWLTGHVKKLLGSLRDLEAGEGLEGMGRGIAFQVADLLDAMHADTKTRLQEQIGRAHV